MKTTSSQLFRLILLATLVGSALGLRAQEPAPAPERPAAPATAEATAPAAPAAEPAVEAERKSDEGDRPLRRIDNPETTEPEATTPVKVERRRSSRGGGPSSEFPFGDHYVPKGSRMSEAVSIFGSTSVDGEVGGDVVSILGNTRVGPEAKVGGAAVAVLGRATIEGPVGDEAVSVLGGLKVNSRVRGEAVSVLGGLELGPKAEIDGDVVVVGGKLTRHPDAIVHGNVVNVPVLGGFADLEWLITWFKRCLLMGRPLAFGANLGWAWAVAFSFLAFYLLLALIFPRGIEKCAVTFETRPGYSVLSSFLTVFLTPVAIVLLAVTVIGAVLVPFVGAGLFAAKLFGKAVMLAWIGRRFTRFLGNGPLGHPFFAVLFGGVLVLFLYTVPLFGFVLYKLLTWLGLGVVVYTVALAMKREKPPIASPGPAPVGGVPPAPSPVVEPVSPPIVAATDLGGTPTATSSVGFAAAGPEFAAATPMLAPIPPPMSMPRPSAPVISAATMPRASFMIRMGALLLDVVLVGLIVAFINGMMPRSFRPEPPSMLLMLALYGAILWKLRGTTIGGIVCGLKVVRLDDRPLDWPTSIVRALSCFLSLVVAGLGFIWIAIDDDKQSWHDKIAGTVVVRVPKGVSLL